MGKPLNVLIADDSEDDVLLIVRALSREGFDVDYCQVDCHDEFETQLAARRWDIVLSDHLMPGFGSFEVLDIVRERQPSLPVIVVSGLGGEANRLAALSAGARAHVAKDNLGQLALEIDREVLSARKP